MENLRGRFAHFMASVEFKGDHLLASGAHGLALAR